MAFHGSYHSSEIVLEVITLAVAEEIVDFFTKTKQNKNTFLYVNRYLLEGGSGLIVV